MKHIDLGNDDELDPDKTEAIPPSDVPSLSHAETQAHAASEKWADDLVRKVTTPPPLEKQSGGAEGVVSLLRDARVISAVAAAADAAIKSRDAVSTKPADSTTLGDVVASITLLNGTVGQVLSAVHGVNPNQYTSPIGPSAPPQNQYTSPIGPSLPPAPPAGGPPLPSGPQPVPPGGGGPIINAPPRHRQIMNRRKRRVQRRDPIQSQKKERSGGGMGVVATAAIGAVGGFAGGLLSATRMLSNFTRQIEDAGYSFEKYAPQVQVAKANQQITNIDIEMRRARVLDSRFAEFTDLQTDANKILGEFKTQAMKVVLDSVLPLMKTGVDLLKHIDESSASVKETYWSIAQWGASFFLSKDEMKTLAEDIRRKLEGINKNTKPKSNATPVADPFMDQFLNMQVPMYAAPKPFRRNRNRPKRMGAIP